MEYVLIMNAVLSVIEHGAEAYQKIRAAAQQSGELTDAQLAEFDKRMETAFASLAWTPRTATPQLPDTSGTKTDDPGV